MKRYSRYLICLLGIAALIVLDQWIKLWSVENLKGTSGRGFIPGIVSLSYAENRGAAFGILQNMRWMFVALGIVAVTVIIWIILKERIKSPVLLAGLSLILAGAIGNLIDRALDGFVVDMFKLEFINFAIFNVADIALTCGGIIICLYLLIKKPI